MLAKILTFFKKDRFRVILLIFLFVLPIFSICIIKPEVVGDSVSYVQSIEVLQTGVVLEGFTPYRIITTFLGLRSIMAIDLLVNNLQVSWLLLNSLLYIAMGMFFYSLLLKISESSKTAFLGTLFLMTNYAAVAFSFRYLMDIGGWAFYVASLYFSYRYLETRANKWLYLASSLVGVGGLFKEYAFLAYVVIFGLIIYINWRQWLKITKLILITGLLAFLPMLLINIYSYIVYDYTYLSWYSAQNVYAYQNKLIEYIKSFGSLYNFGWPLFLGGAYLLLKQSKKILLDPKLFFIMLTILSALVVFVWPVVTRVLFITMPAVVLVSSIFIKKYEKYWYAFLPILALYILSTYFMDSFILNFVTLPF